MHISKDFKKLVENKEGILIYEAGSEVVAPYHYLSFWWGGGLVCIIKGFYF